MAAVEVRFAVPALTVPALIAIPEGPPRFRVPVVEMAVPAARVRVVPPARVITVPVAPVVTGPATVSVVPAVMPMPFELVMLVKERAFESTMVAPAEPVTVRVLRSSDPGEPRLIAPPAERVVAPVAVMDAAALV